jgi:hypothetical protein
MLRARLRGMECQAQERYGQAFFCPQARSGLIVAHCATIVAEGLVCVVTSRYHRTMCFRSIAYSIAIALEVV